MPKVTVEGEMVSCGCRSAGEYNTFVELAALNKMVDEFAAEMKQKLRRKWSEGYTGWDNPAAAEYLRASLREHVMRETPQAIDVANIAAMLWNLRRP